MKLTLLKQLYERNHLHESDTLAALNLVMTLNESIDEDIDYINESTLDSLIQMLVLEKKNALESFIIMMRYFNVIGRHDLYVHLTRYTGMLDVMENIIKRLETLVGKSNADRITDGFIAPILGTPPADLPSYVEKLMAHLNKHLDEHQIETVLAGNNHGLSERAVLPEKVAYEAAPTLAVYLKERHLRKIEELKQHFQENKVWFEQIITKDTIDFVAKNQEVLSAKLADDTLFVTKIPYDTDRYLNAKHKREKHYYGCHCPFAREAIKEGNTLPEKFCYCSAGFAKFPFEVILGQPLKVKVLQSILAGDDICRFAIDLKNINYKK